MFDLRTEAEMRLYSDKLARELALKKQREGEEGSQDNIVAQTPPLTDEGQTTDETTPTTGTQPVG